MIPQRFKESNSVMLAPSGMDNCADIHAFRDGKQVITCWLPSPEERIKIAMGEPLWIGIIGITMPPIFVTADRPFIE